jgi:aminoglycoside phosphotransferase (APT) family kinase protein
VQEYVTIRREQTVLPSESHIVAIIGRALDLSSLPVLRLVGDGADHWAFDVNGMFIARVLKERNEQTAAALEREAALLRILAPVSPLPIPQVVATDPSAGLMVYRRIAGTSLFEKPAPEPHAIVDPLADFVAAIHGVPSETVEQLVQRDEYALDGYLTEGAALMQQVTTCLTSVQRSRVESFLGTPPPPESIQRTLCHNDLGAEHILASDDWSQLTGVIDWSDAALADPAVDIGRVLRDFGFGVAEAALRRASHDEAALVRAVFYARCALIEDLAYGIETSRPQYVAHALGRFDETFS